jgi:dihydroorotate dehydrogenase (NAD+) catalytic subunit
VTETPIQLFGVSFQNPILLAAGTAGFGREVDGVIDLAALGGIVTKAVTPEPRRGHAGLRVAEFRGGMLNAIGLANPGVERVAERDLPWLAARLRGTPARIIVNVAGATVPDYVRVIERLTPLDAITAFEINASCPNTSAGGLEFGSDPRGLSELVRACRGVTTRPFSVKLSPVLPDLPGMAKVARDAGADAVSLVNTLPGFLDRRLGNGQGGLSGPALLPVGVLATKRVREQVGIPVIGVGGVRTAADAREYLAAGATLVAIGTAALADPRVPERVARELAGARQGERARG